MKKFISTILAALFIISALTVSALPAFAAGDTLDFSLTNAAGMQNDYVTIKMSIDNNPGFWAFQFGVFYDSDALILREVTANSEFKKQGDFCDFNETTLNNLRDQYDVDIENGVVPMSRIFRDAPKFGADVENSYVSVIEYESKSVTEDNMYTGEILELTFEIVGIAEDGDYDVILVPDVASVINTADKNDDVPYTWKNAVITVGSKEAKPEEDNPQRTPDDTVKVDTTEKETDAETTKKPVDTFVGDDGNTYYIGEDGEKYVYDPAAFEDEETEGGNKENNSGDETASPDIDVDNTETAEKEKKNNTVLIIIIAAAVLLIIAAVLLFIFISKTKKETEEIENDENNQN